MADRRTLLTVAGLSLLVFGGVLALQGSSPAKPAPGAKPPPPGGKPGQLLRVGSASLRRPAWVRDHGCNAPLYTVTGGLAGWVPCGSLVRAIGPVAGIAHLVINADGTTDGLLSGSVPSYPVAGGWLSVTDVDAIAG